MQREEEEFVHFHFRLASNVSGFPGHAEPRVSLVHTHLDKFTMLQLSS